MFKNRQLWLIVVIAFVDTVAANALGSLTTQFVQDLPAKSVFITGGTAIALGIQLAASPAAGAYSDKRGRRPVVLLTAIGTLLSTFLLLPVKAWGYLANRVAEGTTTPMYVVLRSAATDIAKKDELIQVTGILSFIAAMGTVLGPMVSAGWLILMPITRGTPQPVVQFMVVMAALNIGLVLLFRETKPDKQAVDWSELKRKSINALKVKTLWRQLANVEAQVPGFKGIFVLNLVGSMAMGYYAYFVAFLTQSKLQFTPLETAYFFLGYGSLACVSNALFFRYLLARIPKRVTILVLAILGIVVHILYAFSESSESLLYVVAGSDAVFVTILNGLIGGILSKLVGEGDGQGEMFGNVQALGSVASFASALVNTGLSAVGAIAPFVWSALCFGLLTILILRLPDDARKVTDQKEA